jgi:hypothetical protein
MGQNVYLVIWAGYVHCGVFTKRRLADDYIKAKMAEAKSWGVYRVETVPLNPREEQP